MKTAMKDHLFTIQNTTMFIYRTDLNNRLYYDMI